MTDIILHSPDPARSSRPHSLTASPTVELLERKAERLSLGAVQTDLQTEIKKIWDEEKKRDEIRDTLRDSMRAGVHGSPFTSPTPANENGGSGVWGMGEEIRKIWADERRRSQMSSPVMRYSPVVSPVLERQITHRSVSSKGSVVESLRNQGFGAMLTKTTTGNRSVTSPLVPRASRESMDSMHDREDVHLGNNGSHSPPSATGGLFITNPSASPRSDDDDAEFSRRNPNRNTITMPKRMTSGLHIQGLENNPSRSTSTASKNTLQRAGSIFKDFDGAYRSASLTSNATSVTSDFIDELDRGLGLSSPLVSEAPLPADQPEERPAPSHRSETGYSDSIPPRHSYSPRLSYVKPPIADGMVYYPAPVPRVLNLPKKLSKRPAANSSPQMDQQSQRQSMFFDVRKSAMYGYGPPLVTPDASGRASVVGSDRASNSSSPERKTTPGRMSPSKNNRQSVMTINRKALPAHLRASVFFEGGLPGHNSVAHEVEVKAQSAVLTLESLLDESARAPIAGRRSPNANHARTRSASPEKATRKSKVNYLPLGKWNGDKDDPESPTSVTFDPAHNDDNKEDDSTALAPWASTVLTSFDHFATIEEDETETQLLPSRTRSPPPSPQPAPHTLLAELATRKAAQKSRNRTAADAFPNGTMAATLLELDAVAQMEAENRVKRRTVLAWEMNDVPGDEADDDGRQEDSGGAVDKTKDDENTPLALLPVPPPKSPKRKLMQWSAAGATNVPEKETLLARQAREESEPLSIRRSRLFGTNPNTKPNTTRAVSAAPSFFASDTTNPNSDKENEETETLAQRTLRLKELKQLSNYLANGNSSLKRGNTVRAVSAYTQGSAGEGMDDLVEEEEEEGKGFVEEVLRDAGVPVDVNEGKAGEEGEEEEETLGQRRARLQAESEATGLGARPVFGQRHSTIRPIQPSNPFFQPQQQIHQPEQRTLYQPQQPHQTEQQILYQQQQLFPVYHQTLPLHQQQYSHAQSTPQAQAGGGGLLAQSELSRATRQKQIWLHNSRAVSHNGLGVWGADMVSGLGQSGARTENWVANRGV